MSAVANEAPAVARMLAVDLCALSDLFGRFGLLLQRVGDDQQIPGSYWGECEAGLVGPTLHWRSDTPVHSVLHEACHFICMDDTRRRELNRDAGGDDQEENAVCYLQILLADYVPAFGRDQLMRDMDEWGYSFRLGSTRAWFESDAEDAREWLIRHRLLSSAGALLWRCR